MRRRFVMSSLIGENEGKKLVVEIDGVKYARYMIKTHVITDKDDIVKVCQEYAMPHMKEGDILFVSEKAVACTQKRAIPMKDIKPRPLAKFLCKFVHKSKHGIGLGIPETMEMALREIGTIKILFAAVISAIGKLFGKRGWFYNIVGEKARSIDGPCPNTLPPYNQYVVLAPENPNKVAKDIAKGIGHRAAVVDINDLDGVILGTSHEDMDKTLLVKILKDNPLGQSRQQTPMGIIRVVCDDDLKKEESKEEKQEISGNAEIKEEITA